MFLQVATTEKAAVAHVPAPRISTKEGTQTREEEN